MWFIGVEVEQETSAPPPKKNPGSAPASASPNRYFTENSRWVPLSNEPFNCITRAFPNFRSLFLVQSSFQSFLRDYLINSSSCL